MRKPRFSRRYQTSAVERVNDRASDRAIDRVARAGLFRRRRHGRFWHRVPFEDLAALRQYLSEHLRFVKRATWTVAAATRTKHGDDRFVIRRAVRYELLERTGGQDPAERASGER